MPSHHDASRMPAFLFDVDGTLIDSVYQHVNAWAKTLKGVGIILPNWKVHRRIGMSWRFPGICRSG
jgi:beta-phosphoglucomutase-like phosphatase (HAD superfamily)